MATKVSVAWSGLDSFMAELQTLTADLVDEANTIMVDSATDAKRDIAAAYPAKTGRLRRGLVLKPARGQLLSGAELVQTAPHGFIYEHGTRERANKAGANRGRMGATPTFFPIAEAYRRTAIRDVMFRLYAHGATRVTGSADEEVA
jgi:hypothetical protein